MACGPVTRLILLVALVLQGAVAHAANSNTQSKVSEPVLAEAFDCEPAVPFGRFDHVRCWVDESPYIPPNGDWRFPVSFVRPHPLPDDGSLRIRVAMSGYNARPKVHCEGNHFAAPGFIIVKPCAGHYPDVAQHRVNGVSPMGFWGRYFGTSNSERLALALLKATEWRDSIDMLAGFTLTGTSYGGVGSILQSLMLREANPFLQKMVSVVHSNLGDTLVVKADGGRYHRDNFMQLAWDDYNPENADIIKHSAALSGVYYRLNGSPRDTSVRFDLDFFRLFCNNKRIACFGTWHNAGHNLTEPGVNLPFLELYSAPGMDTRLDQILPVFTHSSANHWGAQGHFNLGLEWSERQWFVDEKDRAVVPIRYRRHTNLGGNLPDQPPSATFNLTLRRFQAFTLARGERVRWVLGKQRGTAEIRKKGEVILRGLRLDSSEKFTSLVLKRAPVPGQ